MRAVRFFLGGEAVLPGVSVAALAEEAKEQGVSIVLPSGKGLDLVGQAAPAQRL